MKLHLLLRLTLQRRHQLPQPSQLRKRRNLRLLRRLSRRKTYKKLRSPRIPFPLQQPPDSLLQPQLFPLSLRFLPNL
jgi:hypothetical protein